MSKLIHASGVSPLPCRYLSQWIFRWDCMASNRRVWSSVRGLSPSQLVSVMKRLNMPNTWAVLTQSYSGSCDNRRSVPVDEGPCWEMWPAGASEADYSNRWCILKPGYSQDHGIHFRLSNLHSSETRYVQDIYSTWGPEPYTDLFLPCYPYCIVLETKLNTMHLRDVHVCDAYLCVVRSTDRCRLCLAGCCSKSSPWVALQAARRVCAHLTHVLGQTGDNVAQHEARCSIWGLRGGCWAPEQIHIVGEEEAGDWAEACGEVWSAYVCGVDCGWRHFCMDIEHLSIAVSGDDGGLFPNVSADKA